ncbi:hypothetical protein AAHA92_11900 [Salvia divinorum]|uniref:Uncharacterized protein n=1 Tax=Salvia divinorum TaxID=28513 RepID=A0ABD1HJV1_SALDI
MGRRYRVIPVPSWPDLISNSRATTSTTPLDLPLHQLPPASPCSRRPLLQLLPSASLHSHQPPSAAAAAVHHLQRREQQPQPPPQRREQPQPPPQSRRPCPRSDPTSFRCDPLLRKFKNGIGLRLATERRHRQPPGRNHDARSIPGIETSAF